VITQKAVWNVGVHDKQTSVILEAIKTGKFILYAKKFWNAEKFLGIPRCTVLIACLQSRDFLHKRRAIELLVHDFAQY
jgi:hypothetical protein